MRNEEVVMKRAVWRTTKMVLYSSDLRVPYRFQQMVSLAAAKEKVLLVPRFVVTTSADSTLLVLVGKEKLMRRILWPMM